MHKYLYFLKYKHFYYIHPSSLSLSLWFGMKVAGVLVLANVIMGPIFRVGKREECGAHSEYWGGPPLGVQILYTFPTPKMGIKQIANSSVTFILRILRFLAESSGVTKLELFQRFPHCKWGFSRCTDSTRLRQDSAAKDIKTGTKLW